MYLKYKEYLTLLLTSLWQEIIQSKQQNLPIMIKNKLHLIVYNWDSKHFNVFIVHCTILIYKCSNFCLLMLYFFRLQKYFNILLVMVISLLIKFISKTVTFFFLLLYTCYDIVFLCSWFICWITSRFLSTSFWNILFVKLIHFSIKNMRKFINESEVEFFLM